MEMVKTIALLVSVLGFAFWVGTVMKANGEDKLTSACHPVEFVTDELIKVTTGLSGFTPNWTVKTKEVMQGGCYYFFSTFLFGGSLDDGNHPVRQ